MERDTVKILDYKWKEKLQEHDESIKQRMKNKGLMLWWLLGIPNVHLFYLNDMLSKNSQ